MAAMNYDELRQLIIDTLAGRPVGTMIYPEGHQEIDLNLLDFAKAISETISTGIAGEAQASTQPIQPSGSNVAYIFQVAPNSTKTFANFRDSGGNAISVTTNSSQAAVGFLLWNGSYWSAMTVYIAVTSPAFETISGDIIQLLDDITPVYPRTKAEAVFFNNDPTKNLSSIYGFVQNDEITVNNDTNKYKDWVGDYKKGQKIIVEASSNNTVSLFFFVQKTDGTYLSSVEIPAGTTKEFILTVDAIAIRLWHTDTSPWGAVINFLGLSLANRDRIDEIENVELPAIRGDINEIEEEIEGIEGDLSRTSFTESNQTVQYKDYYGNYEKDSVIQITPDNTCTVPLYLFIYEGEDPHNSFPILLGVTTTVTVPYDSNHIRIYHINTSVWGAFVEIFSPIYWWVKFISENSGKLSSEKREIIDYSSNFFYDFNGSFVKNSVIQFDADSENPFVLEILIQKLNDAWVNIGNVQPGESKKIILPDDAKVIRYWHVHDTPEQTSANWSADIIIYSQIDANTYRINEIEEEIEGISTEYYKNKKLVTLCDSYGATGQWQAKLSEIKGFIFNASLNNNHYSVGGTTTISANDPCGQHRARLLVQENQIIPDVIIIENVNDGNLVASRTGQQSDSPYMMGERQDLELVNYTEQQVIDYFNNNLSTILSGVTPQHGYRVGLPYNAGNVATILQFNSAPTQNGQLVLKSAFDTRYISVLATDTIQDVIDKILEYSYNRYDITKTSTSIKFTPNIDISYLPQYKVEILTNTTGMSITVQDDQPGSLIKVMTYALHDMTDWSNPASWVDINTITLWSAYKGLFNYLSENFPLAEIFFMFPLAYYVDVTSPQYQYADGNIDTDKVLATIQYGSLKVVQKAVCEYCEIPFWDLKEYACIYPQNVAQYFPANNYHPNAAGYQRWGIACAKYLL